MLDKKIVDLLNSQINREFYSSFLYLDMSNYYYDNSLKIIFGRKIFVSLLNVFTILSLIYLYKNNKKLFYLSILVFINFTMPYAIGHAFNTRFKLDFEWFQYFLVSYFVIYKLKSFRLLNIN